MLEAVPIKERQKKKPVSEIRWHPLFLLYFVHLLLQPICTDVFDTGY